MLIAFCMAVFLSVGFLLLALRSLNDGLCWLVLANCGLFFGLFGVTGMLAGGCLSLASMAFLIIRRRRLRPRPPRETAHPDAPGAAPGRKDPGQPQKRRVFWKMSYAVGRVAVFAVLFLSLFIYEFMCMQVVTQIPLGNREINKQLESMAKDLPADATGDNRLHAWVVEMARLEVDENKEWRMWDWEVHRPGTRYYPPEARPGPPPIPLPEALRGMVEWNKNAKITLDRRESGVDGGRKSRIHLFFKRKLSKFDMSGIFRRIFQRAAAGRRDVQECFTLRTVDPGPTQPFPGDCSRF